MANQNFELSNDDIATIPIRGRDAAGDPVALPIGRSPTLVNSDPASLNAVINGNDLVLNALVDTASNISVEIDDGTLTPFTLVVDIVEDVTPTSVVLDLTAVTHAPQARPSQAPAAAPAPAPSAPASSVSGSAAPAADAGAPAASVPGSAAPAVPAPDAGAASPTPAPAP